MSDDGKRLIKETELDNIFWKVVYEVCKDKCRNGLITRCIMMQRANFDVNVSVKRLND